MSGSEGDGAHAIERLSLYMGHGAMSGPWDADGVCGHWELSKSCQESDPPVSRMIFYFILAISG